MQQIVALKCSHTARAMQYGRHWPPVHTIYKNQDPSLVDENSEKLDSEQAGHELSSVDTSTLLILDKCKPVTTSAYLYILLLAIPNNIHSPKKRGHVKCMVKAVRHQYIII